MGKIYRPNKIQRELYRLSDALNEKRSDISEILISIIEGRKWRVRDIEHRHIFAELPDGTKLEYDTLTTEISFLAPDSKDWKTVKNHTYLG